MQEVINCIGGVQVLFPLLDQVKQSNANPEPEEPKVTSAGTPASPASGEWVMVPSYLDQGKLIRHCTIFITFFNCFFSRGGSQPE